MNNLVTALTVIIFCLEWFLIALGLKVAPTWLFWFTLVFVFGNQIFNEIKWKRTPPWYDEYTQLATIQIIPAYIVLLIMEWVA